MLDKNYTSKEWDKLWKDLDSVKKAPSFAEQAGKKYEFKESELRTGDFGIGASMMGKYADPVKGLQAEIRGGMGHIEFNPSLSGQGMKSFSKVSTEQRRALREIKKVNNVSIGTHADSNVFGLTGFDRYSFNEEKRHQDVMRIKEAIDFAAEVSEGGSITFHAADFLRPMDGTAYKEGEFSRGNGQSDMVLGVVDKTNNSFSQESMVKADEALTVAVKDKAAKPISLSEFGLGKHFVPQFKEDEKTKDVMVEKFDNFRQYAAWLLDEKKGDKKFKEKVKSIVGLKKSNWVHEVKGKNEATDYRILELAAKEKFIDDNKFNLLNKANSNISQIGKQLSEVQKLKDAVEEAKVKSKEDQEVYYVAKDMQQARYRGGLRPISESQLRASAANQGSRDHEISDEDFKEMTKDYIKIEKGKEDVNAAIDGMYAGDYKLEFIDNRLNEIKYLKQNVTSQIDEAFTKLEDSYDTITEVAKSQNEKSFKELGSLINTKNKRLVKEGKDKIYFAIENLFPEHYGSTPEELLDVIGTAKKAMTDQLVDEEYDRKEAKRIADDSIKATFDTGHLHMWKKYFKRKPGEKDEKYDERFNKWALGETKKLIDAGVIGNIHLADNFGHEDDHLTLGQGIVPIKEYMKMFDKARAEGKVIGKFSVEGFDESGEKHGVHEAWKQSGVQIFRGQQATDKWVNLEDDFGSGYGFDRASGGYVTKAHKPYFVFGKYAPSHDPSDWAPWDEMGME